MRRAVAPFRNRNFAIFWSGSFLSNVGRWIQDIIVPYELYRITESGSVIGLAAFLRFAPAVFLGPVSGALADRFQRRTVLQLTQSALALVALGLWVSAATDTATPAVLIVLSSLTGAIYALNGPTWQAFIGELVPREQLAGAITLNSAQMNAAKAIGPGLAGVILATLDAAAGFLMTAVTLGLAMVSIAVLDVERRAAVATRQPVLAAFAGTTRYLLARPALVRAIGAMCIASALGMPILQLTPIFAEEVFDVGPGGFGILAGALGFGGAAAAPVLGGWTHEIPSGRLIARSLLGYGLALMAFAQSPWFPLAVVLMTFVGAGFLFASATVISVLQLGVDDELRGSVAAVFTTAFALAYPLGSLTQGWAAEHAGARITVTIAGAGVAAAALWLVASRRVQAELREGADVDAESAAAAVATTT